MLKGQLDGNAEVLVKNRVYSTVLKWPSESSASEIHVLVLNLATSGVNEEVMED